MRLANVTKLDALAHPTGRNAACADAWEENLPKEAQI